MKPFVQGIIGTVFTLSFLGATAWTGMYIWEKGYNRGVDHVGEFISQQCTFSDGFMLDGLIYKCKVIDPSTQNNL